MDFQDVLLECYNKYLSTEKLEDFNEFLREKIPVNELSLENNIIKARIAAPNLYYHTYKTCDAQTFILKEAITYESKGITPTIGSNRNGCIHLYFAPENIVLNFNPSLLIPKNSESDYGVWKKPVAGRGMCTHQSEYGLEKFAKLVSPVA